MDIGHNLFYNENTVRSENFLENHTGFGKETMRRLIEVNTTDDKRSGRTERKRSLCRILSMSILLLSVLLCGCTRREELVLEDVTTGREQQLTDKQLTSQEDKSGKQDLQEKGIQEQHNPQEQNVPEQETLSPGEELQTIYVHVCGAVITPDVYELPTGSRVYEAVQAAGGFAEDADSSYVNQAQKLTDGVKLVIPTLEQTQQLVVGEADGTEVGIVGVTEVSGTSGVSDVLTGGGTEVGQGGMSDGKININTASETELCNIPGIGAVRAAAIVAYRQEKGSFTSIEDIKNVSGIKEGTYEKIKDSIKVD